MYKKEAGNDKQGKDAGNRTLYPYRNFSQAITLIMGILLTHTLIIKIFFPHHISVKPSVRASKTMVNAEMGESIKLSCDVTGNPSPNITWHRTGRSISPTAVIQNYGKSLSILKTEMSDSGSYKCVARNKVGFSADYVEVSISGMMSGLVLRVYLCVLGVRPDLFELKLIHS